MSLPIPTEAEAYTLCLFHPDWHQGVVGIVAAVLVALAIAVAVLLWWFATTILASDDSLIREFAPQEVLPALGGLIERGVLLPDTAASMWRLLVGLSIAAVIGIPLGLLIGLNPTVDRAVRPVTQTIR